MATEEDTPENQPSGELPPPAKAESPQEAAAPRPKKMGAEIAVIAGILAAVVVFIGALGFFLIKAFNGDNAKEEDSKDAFPEPPKIHHVQPKAPGKSRAAGPAEPAPDPIPIKNKASSSAVERELGRALIPGVVIESVFYEDALLTSKGKPALGKQILLNGVIPKRPDDASAIFHQFMQNLRAEKLLLDIAEGFVQRKLDYQKNNQRLVFSLGIVLKPGYGLKKFNGMPSLTSTENTEGWTADSGAARGKKRLLEMKIMKAMASRKLKKTTARPAPGGGLVLKTAAGDYKEGDSFAVKVKGKRYIIQISGITRESYTLQTGASALTLKH